MAGCSSIAWVLARYNWSIWDVGMLLYDLRKVAHAGLSLPTALCWYACVFQ